MLHRKGHLDLDTLRADGAYKANAAYNRSKLANLVFALELHRRLTAAGSPVRSIAAHPGYAVTNLQASVPPGFYRFLLTKLGNPLIAVPAATGALPLLYAATAPDAQGGALIGPGGLGEMRGAPASLKPSPEAADPASGERLWSVSEELTGVRFTAS
ncbi:hypothetical protein [Actinoplanes sp. NPDC026619]|uniref:hypothetical protein n=1 Tax=Actinoplanes sp. NPDC026619 TaxID=3155798 RepID=UPI0033F384A5